MSKEIKFSWKIEIILIMFLIVLWNKMFLIVINFGNNHDDKTKKEGPVKRKEEHSAYSDYNSILYCINN